MAVRRRRAPDIPGAPEPSYDPLAALRALNPLHGNPLATRADLSRARADLFAPLRPCFSPGGARVEIDARSATSDRAAAGLEGFARPLWGLAAGAGPDTDWSGYRRGLAAGCDPAHPEYWGPPRDGDQRLVEATAIAFALCLAHDRLWTPLAAPDQARIADWLAAARACAFHDNNWRLMELVIDHALRRIGRPGDATRSAAARDAIAAMQVSDGWYRDGRSRRLDHYNGFAFHFYALLLAALEPGGAHAASARREAARFARDYARLFADDGAMLPFGRSLIYRFAGAAFWGALAFAGVEALPWGEIKGLYLRHLRWWAAQPIAGRDGLLGHGFAYPLPALAEAYSNPASPYWAFKAFLPLALDGDHPFWTAEETQRAAEPEPTALAAPGLIVMRGAGQCAALAAGQDNLSIRHGAEKYARFAYSSRYGFGLDEDRHAPRRMSAENMILFSGQDRGPSGRAACEAAAIADDLLWSRWRPWSDVVVETYSWWAWPWHVRVHSLSTPAALDCIEGGFAVARPESDHADLRTIARGVAAVTQDDAAAILDCGPFVRQPRLLIARPNTNIMHARTIVPQLIGHLPPGAHVLATAVLATPDIAGGLAAWAAPPGVPPIDELAAAIAARGRPIGAHQLPPG